MRQAEGGFLFEFRNASSHWIVKRANAHSIHQRKGRQSQALKVEGVRNKSKVFVRGRFEILWVTFLFSKL